MAQTKATRKFEKTHLKDAIKRRKEGAKIKQKQQMKAKRKERVAEDNKRATDLDGKKGTSKHVRPERSNALAHMDVDEFFQGGFGVPAQPHKKSQKAPRAKTGKRKRSDEGDDDAEVSSGESSEQLPVAQEDGSEGSDEDDLADHQAELKALAAKDPEFYNYLKENDAELLDFVEDSNLADIDDLSSSDQDAPKAKKQKKGNAVDEDQAAHSNEVSVVMIRRWHQAMQEKHSLRAMKEAVLAFRAAAHLNDEANKEYKYSLSDPEAYHELLVTVLRSVPIVLEHHLPVKDTAGSKIRMPTDTKKYRTLTPLFKSHAMSIIHLLGHLSDAATLRLTLSSLLPLLPYFLSFKKLVRDLSRAVASIWSDSANTEATRIAAFLVLRRLVVIGDPGIKDSVLKAAYQGLVKGSRGTTIHTLAGVNLMKNSAAELWGLDANQGYTTGFTFIRQLAIHLRSSITNNAKENFKLVYNWQYIHSLDFWSRVLSSHCDGSRESGSGKESPLHPLIYPLVQVTLGAMRLIPTATYFPLRFHLIRSLLRISLATGTYVPLATPIYEVLTSAEMRKPPKPSTLKSLDFSTSLRCAKSYLRTRVYQDGVGEQVVELLSEFFLLWGKSIAFPELALPVIVMLKRWLKEMSDRTSGNKNGKVNGIVQLLVQKLEAHSRHIEERRAKVDFAPNNRTGVEAFLKDIGWEKTPLGAFVQGQRKQKEEKARMLEEGRREEERKRDEDRLKQKKEREEGRVDPVIEDEDEDDEDVSGDEDDVILAN